MLKSPNTITGIVGCTICMEKDYLFIYLFISPPYKYIIIFDGNKDLDHIFNSLAGRYRPERGFSIQSC
jgi:hypothetical protein